MVSVDEAIDNIVGRKHARRRSDKEIAAQREAYFATVFLRDTPLPLPSFRGMTVATVPLERLEELAGVGHRQLAQLARLEMDLRMVGGGC